MIHLEFINEAAELSRDDSDAALRATVATALTVANFLKDLGMEPFPIQLTVNGEKYTVESGVWDGEPW